MDKKLTLLRVGLRLKEIENAIDIRLDMDDQLCTFEPNNHAIDELIVSTLRMIQIDCHEQKGDHP